ncbi:MAG TPA: FemAB family XrtA/PEP-CTERM system-associated protein [Gemmatimonadaceae bacterium]|nr:FemAB family XrtA/PEP-CTERM system-associated protein [Gemmatimonadaceae bacterium]
MTVTIERYHGAPAEWNGFVRRQPDWTHFHLAEWRDVIAEAHGHDSPYLCARDREGELRGVLPLVRVASPVFGRYLVSMPYVNYGGPLGDPLAVRELVRVAGDMAREEPGTLLELRSRSALDVALTPSHRKITCVLNVPPGDPEPLWRAFDANVRRRVRRAQKAGIAAAFGPEQLDAFYQVYAHHMRDLGTPAQPRALFESIRAHFPHDVTFGAAYLGARPVATIAGFRWGDEFEVTWASALVAYKELAANMLVYWAFIERMIAEGVTRFNFGRCTPGGGTHRFKSQWGAVDEALWWYEGNGGDRATTPAPTDPAFAWGPRVWKRLPTALATAVGPSIVRYIP